MKRRDHGGNLDAAMARYGGSRDDWVDLSTGINPTPYPLPDLSRAAWAELPTRARMADLARAAADAYRTRATVVPFAGAQGVIQSVPHLVGRGEARVLGPTYNEHAAALEHASWQVTEAGEVEALKGARVAVVVNPNNPDGRSLRPEALLALAEEVELLVVDESFCDVTPEVSVAPLLSAKTPNVLVQRSFGKFFGLAGVRLGFALANGELAERLQALAGPWPVSGVAIEIAEVALRDFDWQASERERLADGVPRLRRSCEGAGWEQVGGTSLFQTFSVSDAEAAQAALAERRVWSRVFPYSRNWIRLGLPPEDRWEQVERAIAAARV
ncbi:MAG: threonine-phosphate decarboxylase CobD [Pseudomonadota bacterium]